MNWVITEWSQITFVKPVHFERGIYVTDLGWVGTFILMED